MSNFPMPQPGQTGYIYVGNTYGNFKDREGRSVSYCNVFVVSAVESDPTQGRYGEGLLEVCEVFFS